MSDGFIKLNRTPLTEFLLVNHGHAYCLLSLIAWRARRTLDSSDGRRIGYAHVGYTDFEKAGFSEQNYRTAKNLLVKMKIIEIVETCRTRKKKCQNLPNGDLTTESTTDLTTHLTTVGTLVNLLDSDVFDINPEVGNDRSNDRPNDPSNGDLTTNEEEEFARLKGASERARPKIQRLRQHNVQKQTGQILPAISAASRSPLLSEEKQKDLLILKGICKEEELRVTENDLRQWLRKYTGDYIFDQLDDLIKRIDKGDTIPNQGGWMQKALDSNYLGQQKNIKANREFAMKFKEENNWQELAILEKYCTVEETGYDFQLKINPKDFKKLMEEKFRNFRGIAWVS